MVTQAFLFDFLFKNEQNNTRVIMLTAIKIINLRFLFFPYTALMQQWLLLLADKYVIHYLI